MARLDIVLCLVFCALAFGDDERKKDSKIAEDLTCDPIELDLPEVTAWCDSNDPLVKCYDVTFHDFSAVRPDLRADSEQWWNEDFERLYYCINDADGADPSDIVTGLVKTELGPDGLPQFNGDHPNAKACPFNPSDCPAAVLDADNWVGGDARCKDPPVTTANNFNQWYMSEEACKAMGTPPQWFTFTSRIPFFRETEQDTTWEFNSQIHTVNSDSDEGGFFWLDDAGWEHQQVHDNKHNYGFTTQIHMTFEFESTKSWTFSGDDDVWVFVDGQLALDLGGVHHQYSRTLDWSKCGAVGNSFVCGAAAGINTGLEFTMSEGSSYALNVFHAERHTSESNFRISTNFKLQENPPPPPSSPPSPPPTVTVPYNDKCFSQPRAYECEEEGDDSDCMQHDANDNQFHYTCSDCTSRTNSGSRRKLMFGSFYQQCWCVCVDAPRNP